MMKRTQATPYMRPKSGLHCVEQNTNHAPFCVCVCVKSYSSIKAIP